MGLVTKKRRNGDDLKGNILTYAPKGVPKVREPNKALTQQPEKGI